MIYPLKPFYLSILYLDVMLGTPPFGSLGVTPVIAGCDITLLLMVLMYLGYWHKKDWQIMMEAGSTEWQAQLR